MKCAILPLFLLGSKIAMILPVQLHSEDSTQLRTGQQAKGSRDMERTRTAM